MIPPSDPGVLGTYAGGREGWRYVTPSSEGGIVIVPTNNARSNDNGDKAYKKYNDQLKMLESLEKRESDLLQKMSQADPERDSDMKLGWAGELVEVLTAKKKLRKDCREFLREVGN